MVPTKSNFLKIYICIFPIHCQQNPFFLCLYFDILYINLSFVTYSWLINYAWISRAPLNVVKNIHKIHQHKKYSQKICIWWSNGLVVKALDSQSRGPMFETTGWLQGRLSLSSFRGRWNEYQEFLGTEW